MIDTTKTTINPATTSRLPERFSAVARTLHWLVAGGIVVQYLLAELAEKAADRGEQLTQLAVLANHKSMGITLLVLVAFRLLWRSFNRPPPPLPPPPPWHTTKSRSTPSSRRPRMTFAWLSQSVGGAQREAAAVA